MRAGPRAIAKAAPETGPLMPHAPHPPVATPEVAPAIRPLQPLQWLELAWHDVRRAPGVSLAHGSALAVLGWLLAWAAHDRFWLLAGSLSGFALVAPVLATGLYAISRDLGRGRPVGFDTVWRVWCSLDARLMAFGGLLALAGTGWWLTSAALITLGTGQPVEQPADFLRHVVVAPPEAGFAHWLFEVWLMLGALMAAPVFASSVVALPLLLDRKVGVFTAVLTSWRVVVAHPVPMAFWAALVMTFTLLGLGSLMLGLVWVMPMLGHASWYAYRDLVLPETAA